MSLRRCLLRIPVMTNHGKLCFRPATPVDATAIHEIYAPYVRDTAISFETEVPTVTELSARIEKTQQTHAWVVAESDAGIVGYAYASEHKARSAYRWSVTVSVYLRPDAQRLGLGSGLYQALFAALRERGYVMAYAGIVLPNAGSVGLHRKLGFEPVGIYRNVGYKLGHWHDVAWWQLQLQPPPTPAIPLR